MDEMGCGLGPPRARAPAESPTAPPVPFSRAPRSWAAVSHQGPNPRAWRLAAQLGRASQRPEEWAAPAGLAAGTSAFPGSLRPGKGQSRGHA